MWAANGRMRLPVTSLFLWQSRVAIGGGHAASAPQLDRVASSLGDSMGYHTALLSEIVGWLNHSCIFIGIITYKYNNCCALSFKL